MTIEIEKNNNKELVPLEHYLDAYRKADPEEISARTGFHFDAEKTGVFGILYGKILSGCLSGVSGRMPG